MHKTAYAKGTEWYETGSKKGQDVWKDAGPMFHKTHTSLKASLALLHDTSACLLTLAFRV